MTILVCHASKRGGTEGIAATIADALRDAGHDVRLEPAAGVRGLDGARAVVVAGSLYATRWHGDARRFVRKHAAQLRELPVWLVASGPLDDSADAGTLPPVPHLRDAAASVRARGTVTFGGRLEPDAKGFPASAMAKTPSGAWRNPERIRQWAGQVHAELGG